MNDDEKIITLWLMVYDQDPEQSYLFTCKDKVLASVEGLVRSVAPDIYADRFVAMAMNTINETWHSPFIACSFQGTHVFIHRLELDRHNLIHKTLLRCRHVLEESWESGDKRHEAVMAIDELLKCPVSDG